MGRGAWLSHAAVTHAQCLGGTGASDGGLAVAEDVENRSATRTLAGRGALGCRV